MIPTEQYKKILEVLPILCVDIVIKNKRGEYLLVKRANEPLKGQWWVIGGRVHKGETMKQAAVRKVKEELSLDVKTLKFLGYYEEIFKKNHFGVSSGIQTVSIVFLTVIDGHQKIKLDYQSSDWKYSKNLPANLHINSFNEHQ